jgi:hypothetical protein
MLKQGMKNGLCYLLSSTVEYILVDLILFIITQDEQSTQIWRYFSKSLSHRMSGNLYVK